MSDASPEPGELPGETAELFRPGPGGSWGFGSCRACLAFVFVLGSCQASTWGRTSPSGWEKACGFLGRAPNDLLGLIDIDIVHADSLAMAFVRSVNVEQLVGSRAKQGAN